MSEHSSQVEAALPGQPAAPNVPTDLVDPAVRVTMPAKRRVKLREVLTTLPVGWMLGRRDMKIKYKQSALGPLWLVLQPLAMLTAITVGFSAVTNIEHRGRAVCRLRPRGACGLDLCAVHLCGRTHHPALESAGGAPQPMPPGRARHRHDDLGSTPAGGGARGQHRRRRDHRSPPHPGGPGPVDDRLAVGLHVGGDAPDGVARCALQGRGGFRSARGAGRDLPDAGPLSAQHHPAEGRERPRLQPGVRAAGGMAVGAAGDLARHDRHRLRAWIHGRPGVFGWYVFGRMETRFADYV